MRFVHIPGTLIVLVMSCLLGAGVALAKKTPVEPDFVDPSFSPEDVGTLVVLSAVDIRKDKSIEFKDLDGVVHAQVRSSMKKSVYQPVYRSGTCGVSEITEDDLEYLEQPWIRQFGDNEDRWVLLLVLEDLAKKKTFGGAFGAQCSGYLFDAAEGKVVWRHSTVASLGQGGLAAMGMKKMIRNDTVKVCFRNALKTLPGQRRRR